MSNNVTLRKWATPLTIGAFALSAISGVLLFFHVNLGLVKVVHEWGSWFLVIGGALHVIGSRRAFAQYFSRPTAKAIMAAFALVIVASLLPLGGSPGGHKKRLPPGVLSKALPKAPFTVVAGMAQHKPEELMKELGSQGIVVNNKEETIHEIAVRNNKQDVDILNLVF